MSGKWFTYMLSPVDYRWELMPTVKEVAAKLVSSKDDEIGYMEYKFPSLKKFLSDWEEAQSIVKGWWEGDFTEGPCVFCVPVDDIDFSYGFVWKQNNNGSTFVISQVELHHLKEFSIDD